MRRRARRKTPRTAVRVHSGSGFVIAGVFAVNSYSAYQYKNVLSDFPAKRFGCFAGFCFYSFTLCRFLLFSAAGDGCMRLCRLYRFCGDIRSASSQQTACPKAFAPVVGRGDINRVACRGRRNLQQIVQPGFMPIVNVKSFYRPGLQLRGQKVL